MKAPSSSARLSARSYSMCTRVGVVSIVFDDSVSYGLEKNVPERGLELTHAQAPVEIVVVTSTAPERNSTLGENIVHEFCDRSMQLAHHRAELFAICEITQLVVMVIHQRGDDRDESVNGCEVLESIPEDRLCFLGFECRISVSTPRGDEVNAVVPVPVFALVAPIEELVRGVLTSPKPRHEFQNNVDPVAVPL